tara:strand:- start:481 stop:1452 length:972 start_codon:yes stop_codon:yes gene_type:complete
MINNLVLGGGGYTGSILVKKLLQLNQKVTVVDNFLYDKEVFENYKLNPNLTIVNSCIFEFSKLKKIINDFNYIFPLNGLVGDPLCQLDTKNTLKQNVDSLQLILDNFNSNTAKIIYPSSCSVYGLVSDPADEGSLLNPQSLYAETKIECENLLEKLDNKSAIILRLPTIFGLSLRNRFDLVVNKMTADLILTGTIKVYNPNSKRPLLSVGDLANIYIYSQNINNKHKIYNIGSDRNNFSLEMIAREVVKSLSGKIKETNIQYHDESDDKRSYLITLERFKNDFSYTNFTSLNYEIRKLYRLIDYNRSNDWFESKRYNNTIYKL